MNRKSIGHGVVVHELKSDPDMFMSVVLTMKTAEMRFDDRDFQPEDFILLRQTKHTSAQMHGSNKALFPLIYTGRHLLLKITHIHGGIGMEAGYVALSFKMLD